MTLVKAAVVLACLLLVLGACGAGWVTRWIIGMALGALLVVAAGLILLMLL